MGSMGRGWGLFQYLPKINYDSLSSGKINYASFYVSFKGIMRVKNDNQQYNCQIVCQV